MISWSPELYLRLNHKTRICRWYTAPQFMVQRD